MCLVHVWYWWPLANLMVDLLSEKRVVEGGMILKICERREQSYRASFAAMAMYSASVVDKAIIFCYLALHKMVPP